MTAASTVLTARESIFHFFRGLPVMALINLILLGSFEGNLNYIFFAAGMSFLAPTTAVLSNMLFEFVVSTFKAGSEYILPILIILLIGSMWLIVAGALYELNTTYIVSGVISLIITFCAFFGSGDDSLWSIPNGSSCTLFETISETPLNSMNSVPTTWTVMTTFFFVYLICNAFEIYNRPVPKSADPISVNARKTRCGVSIFILILMLVFVLAGRYTVSNCETPIGILFGTALGVYTGYLWHSFLRACGMGKFDDIFGISNRLLSREAAGDSAPKVCVPVKDKD